MDLTRQARKKAVTAMIDAYEIGIQLALQDDVSAGLQVIGRELEEVDRAIEATSAKLGDLGNAAHAAVGSTAAALASRKAPSTGGDAEGKAAEPAAATAAPEATPGAAQASAPAVAAPAPTFDSQASSRAERPVAEMSGSEASKSVAPAPEVTAAADVGRREPTSAPIVVQVEHAAEPVSPAAQVALVSDPELEPQAAGNEPGMTKSAPTPATPATRSMAPPKRTSGAQAASERTITASVGLPTAPVRAERGGTAAMAAPWRPNEPTPEQSRRPIAPWSGVETRAAPSRPDGFAERPAAPQARQGERMEGMSGSVMLDGHLVGQWLSEQMAKEASRPPSGTSFFDPRQTPAWSASGSL